MSQSPENPTVALDPPSGVVQASVDDKGRLNLPEKFSAYLEAAGVVKVFCTSFDLRQARIYPMELWRHNQNVLREAVEESESGERMAYFAQYYGGESELKGGRILLPAALREGMGLTEKQPVFISEFSGRINLLTRKVHEETIAAYHTHQAADMKLMRAKGLK